MHTVVDVVANYNSLVCDDLKMFMEDTQFIKVCARCCILRVSILELRLNWVCRLSSHLSCYWVGLPNCLFEGEYSEPRLEKHNHVTPDL